VTIGVDTSFARNGNASPALLNVLEIVFLSLYVIELGMRFGGLGCRAIKNAWVQFDMFLVICGLLDLLKQIIDAVWRSSSSSMGFLDKVLLVRTLRLARLARVLRLMIKFHTLWMLVQGLVNSLLTLIWTGFTISILLYVFSVLGVELMQPDAALSDQYNTLVEDNFSSLPVAMLTLLQGLTLDSFSAIYRPLVMERPELLLYFVPFVLIVSIALMNLVTALMVNSSLEQASSDKNLQEQEETLRRKELVTVLRRAFEELDADDSGMIDVGEMRMAPKDIQDLLYDIVGGEDPVQIFELLDLESKGRLEVDQFCDGLIRLSENQSLENLRIMRQCNLMVDMLKGIALAPVFDNKKRQSNRVSTTSAGGATPPQTTYSTEASGLPGNADGKGGESAPPRAQQAALSKQSSCVL